MESETESETVKADIPQPTFDKKDYDDILKRFIEEGMFLNPSLCLECLSKELGIAKYRLSLMFKEKGFKNFNEFVNFYRIEKSKVLLANKPDNLVIESIAFDSGFNSRATFFRVFKSLTGMTPTQFQQTTHCD